MMIFKKAIPRRAFLRGVGATLALPLLDGMVPALAGPLDTAGQPATRLSFVYVPNGMIMDHWTPATEGAAFELTPILEPLAAFRDRTLVLSGLALKNADALLPGEGAVGNHSRASATFLSGVHPKKTEGADMEAGITVDQIAAKEFGKQTQLASLEIAMESELVGTCERGYSCAYLNTLCWRSPTTPMPMEIMPRGVFERLFGDSGSTAPAERRARLRENRSILDSVTDEVTRLLKGLGPTDRGKLGQYLDAIRDVERRIQIAEQQSDRELPALERPVGIPATFAEYAKLMFDLQVLAFQTDMTRVISVMVAREQSARAYPELGVGDPHHPLTHHNGDPEKVAKVIKINIFHMQLFAYFLEKLRSTPDGDGSLLDHTMIVLGSAISDGNMHLHDDLPILLVDGGVGRFQGGRHLRYPHATPLANLYLTLLDKVGVDQKSLGDSTGKLDLRSA
ncbi:MAG: DUF1552 domain-containing protein [Acidobacteria bacterium]|nr:DUF1552 domain-containing protein [Acidobacteriota bacterium]